MKIIDQSHILETEETELKTILKKIEKAARTCYKSEGKIKDGSDLDLCKKLINRGHEAMLEHAVISVRFITDRGVTHELVRHRTGVAFGQESTRYVKYDGDTEFIRPSFEWGNDTDSLIYQNWENAILYCEAHYKNMIKAGASPQEARAVLPNSLKTEIVVTANIREWRHIFKLRTSAAAHPQIRSLMIGLLQELKEKVPVLFEDLNY